MNAKNLKVLYEKVKLAKVGETVQCPCCRTSFIKTNYQQAFCKSKKGTVCKDKYWNTVTPQKRNNTTRISPASNAYMAMVNTLRMGGIHGKKFQGYTSEGYRIIDGVAYDEFDEAVYDVDPYDDTHPFDVGDAGDKDRY